MYSTALKELRQEQGITFMYLLKTFASIVFFDVWYHIVFKPRTFQFNGKSFRYFYHPHARSWRTERCVEIALAIKVMKDHKHVLEIGNVLAHKIGAEHDRTVVDKYEQASGVINEDVATLNLARKFDLVISISTMEHVGSDEDGGNNEKLLVGFDKLLSHLSVGGRLFVTMPVGQNPALDRFISDGRLPSKNMYYLKRVSKNNKWVQVDSWDDVRDCKYGYPYHCANAIVVIDIIKTY